MAFTAVAPQTVRTGQDVLLTDPGVSILTGPVIHRSGSGVVTLRNLTYAPLVKYHVSAHGNIALPAAGAAGEISLAIAVDGEPVASATGRVTPAAAAQYFNVGMETTVYVPRGCCAAVSLENTSGVDIDTANVVLEVTPVR